MCSRDFGEEGGPRRDRPVSLFFLGCFCFKLCLFLSDVLLWGLGWLGQHHCITSTALGLMVFGLFLLSGFTRGGSKRARDEGEGGGFNTFLSILSWHLFVGCLYHQYPGFALVFSRQTIRSL